MSALTIKDLLEAKGILQLVDVQVAHQDEPTAVAEAWVL